MTPQYLQWLPLKPPASADEMRGHDRPLVQPGFDRMYSALCHAVDDTEARGLAAGQMVVNPQAVMRNSHEITIAMAKAEAMVHMTTQIASKLSSQCTQMFQMQM
jgi:hypothetical protein